METFRPRPSWGWAWVLATALFVAALLGLTMAPLASEGMPAQGSWILLLTGGLMVLLVAYMLLVAALFPTMRYELEERELVLRYGPILAYRIPYDSIDDVRRRDLQWTVWSSMRFPGLALWGVLYSDVGKVYMCSTRTAEGVLLITTAGRKYGISPAEEDRFADTLQARIEQLSARGRAAPGVSDADATAGSSRLPAP
jgi:beta-lactamase superfamily II metal-dependent hydrolase